MLKDEDEIIGSSGEAAFAEPSGLSPSLTNRKAKLEAIRDLIINNNGKVLRIADFKRAAQTTTAPYYLHDLIREGHVVRHKTVGEKGHHYTYEWIEDARPIAAGTTKLSSEQMASLLALLQEWQQTTVDGVNESELAQQQFGATKFVNWVKDNRADKKEQPSRPA